jgi:hypothetical protein
MNDVRWGAPYEGVRFGLRPPAVAEAGGSILVGLLCHNVGNAPVRMFGFHPAYPRALRVSPPKADRPYIRVSFGDVNVLHPLDAFSVLAPGATLETSLDLSFAFDRRGTGTWQLAFAYDAVRTGAHFVAYRGGDEAPQSPVVDLLVSYSRSLRDAGIDEATEAKLDGALYAGEARLLDLLRHHGAGGVAFAARRVARVLSPGAESIAGWNALDALALLGPAGHRRRQRGARRDPARRPGAGVRRALARVPARVAAGPVRPALRHHAGAHRRRAGHARQPAGGLDGRGLGHPRPAPGADLRQRRAHRDLARPGLRVQPHAPHHAAPARDAGLGGGHPAQRRVAGRSAARARPPDEPRPAFEVQLGIGGPFSRQVSMWNGEWRRGPSSTWPSSWTAWPATT